MQSIQSNFSTLQSALDAHAVSIAKANKPETVEGVSAPCPHCSVYSAFTRSQSTGLLGPVLDLKAPANRYLIQALCASCNRLIVVSSQHGQIDEGEKRLHFTLLWPKCSRSPQISEHAPDYVKKDHSEACKISADSPTASILMARRCLQSIIRRGMSITRRTLFEEIEAACESSFLHPATASMLSHVKDLGNLNTHPEAHILDDSEVGTADIADYVLDVIEQICIDLFEKPVRQKLMNEKLVELKSARKQHSPRHEVTPPSSAPPARD